MYNIETLLNLVPWTHQTSKGLLNKCNNSMEQSYDGVYSHPLASLLLSRQWVDKMCTDGSFSSRDVCLRLDIQTIFFPKDVMQMNCWYRVFLLWELSGSLNMGTIIDKDRGSVEDEEVSDTQASLFSQLLSLTLRLTFSKLYPHSLVEWVCN